MKVLRLQVHNVLRISDVDLSLEGHNLVLIGGRNGQGKTSAIKALLMALCGKKNFDFPEVALKEGESSGWIRVDLSGNEDMGDLQGYTVEMNFRRKRGGAVEESFRLLDSTGEEAPTPRDLLNRLYTLRGFDPLSFEKAKPKEQAEMIRKLLGLDFSDLEKEYNSVYANRTEQNKRVAQLEAQRKGMRPPANAPKSKVVVSELVSEVERANLHNRKGERSKDDHASRVKNQASYQIEYNKLQQELDSVKFNMDRNAEAIQKLEGEIAEFVPIDVEPIKAKIAKAEELNAAYELAIKVAELDSRIREESYRADDMTDRLADIKESKQKRMEEAKWPVEGMSLDSDGVTLDGLPFEQASRAKRMRTSVLIGMSMNPTLRLMVTEHGSDCDLETLKELDELCKEKDYQLLMEFVTRSKDDEELCAVVFEDGTAKEIE